MPTVNRGEVWIVDLGLPGKIRPCLGLSIAAGLQARALVTLVAHTTSVRGSKFEVAVRAKFLATGVFDAQNMLTVPEVKLIRKLGAFHRISLRWLNRGCDTGWGYEARSRSCSGRPSSHVSHPAAGLLFVGHDRSGPRLSVETIKAGLKDLTSGGQSSFEQSYVIRHENDHRWTVLIQVEACRPGHWPSVALFCR